MPNGIVWIGALLFSVRCAAQEPAWYDLTQFSAPSFTPVAGRPLPGPATDRRDAASATHAKDATRDFLTWLDAARGGHASVPVRAKDYCWLLARGMVYTRDSQSLVPTLEGLRSMGLCAELIDGPTDGLASEAVPKIREAILTSPKRVVLIGHSKGGLNAVAALGDRRVAAKVDALVLLQSPYYGAYAPSLSILGRATPVPFYTVPIWMIRKLGMRFIPPRLEALRELLPEKRQNSPFPESMTRRLGIQIYSIVSQVSPNAEELGGRVRRQTQSVQRYIGESSDGRVVPWSGIAPNSCFAWLDGWTHNDLTTDDATRYSPLWSGSKDPDLARRIFPATLVRWVISGTCSSW